MKINYEIQNSLKENIIYDQEIYKQLRIQIFELDQ